MKGVLFTWIRIIPVSYTHLIGLIMPYEKNFCASCNRLRVSAKGKLHLCLFGEEGIELRDLLQSHEPVSYTHLQRKLH